MLRNILSTLTAASLSCYLVPVYAADIKSNLLPEPLTLELALGLIDQQHPELRLSNAELVNAHSNLKQALANNDLNINLKANARWISPSDLALNQDNEDHRVGLYVNKTLYDFGRSSSHTNIANQHVISSDFHYLSAQQNQHINVMQRYFNVVLADLQFYRYNEEMAIAFIQYDRIKIRKDLGQNTEVDVAEKEVEYNRIRRLRAYSQNQQRVTRSLLAQSLNKPTALPETVERPKININKRKLPDIEKAQKSALENSPLLKSLRAKLAAAKQNIKLAQTTNNPVLTGELEAFGYAREIRSSDQWHAQITLNVPLWSGGRVDAAVAKAKAEMYKIEAELSKQEFLVQQQILELLLSLESLKIQYEEVVSGMSFSELSLDQNRALYELEVTSDLGYSMVKFSEAERKVVKASFDIAIVWAQLDALRGILLNKTNKI